MFTRSILIFGFFLMTLSSASARPWFIFLDSSTPDKNPENFGIYPSIIKTNGVLRLYVDVHVHSGNGPLALTLKRLYSHPASVSSSVAINLEKTKHKDTTPNSAWYRGVVTLSIEDISHLTMIESNFLPWNEPPPQFMQDFSAYRIPLDCVQIKEISTGNAK